MQVYKAYFKVIRKHIVAITMYFMIFVIIAMIITSSMGDRTIGEFAETKTNIAFFNDDGDSALIAGLKDYLTVSANIVDVKDDTDSIQDALFFDKIKCVLRIPEGFTESFLNGSGNAAVQRTAGSVSAGTVNADLLVDKYLRTASLYVNNVPGISQGDIVRSVERDLKQSVAVDMNDYNKPADADRLSYYFRFHAYSILLVMIMGITSIMMAFNKKDLAGRNLCSPLSPVRMNLQLVAGNITFALAVWAALCVVIFILYGSISFNAGTALLCLNSLVFTLASLSIAFLLGKFIRSGGAQAAITNVVSLGLCFLSGVFVEQALLGKTVLTIASFTPTYWYVKAVDDIRGMVTFSAQNIAPVIYSMLIELGFAALFIIIALVVSKQRKLSNV